MRSRYSRSRRSGAGRYSTSGHTVFGNTGWLFADLLLALALAFLLATTFGAPSQSTARVKPHLPKPTSTTIKPKKPKPPGQPQPALDLKYVTVPLNIDPGDISASAIRQTILSDSQLKGRRAGLVLLFAGGPDPNGTQWEQIDNQVWSILQAMNKATSQFKATPLFDVAVSQQFWNGQLALNQVKLEVYLFKMS